jgi:hypothetical protein
MQSRFASASLGRAAAGLASALWVIAALWAIAAEPAFARSAPIDQLDLTVRPTDLAAPQHPVPALPPLTDALANVTEPVNPVDEVDKVRPTVTPNRRPSALGPLGGLAGEQGGVLQELLEDKTIPLFRVRMESPF